VRLDQAVESLTQKVVGPLTKKLPAQYRDTLFLRAFGFLKVPLLFFISPSVTELTGERCVVKVPLNRRTKNHWNSMYFGALAAGADCAGGLIAMRQIQEEGNLVTLLFKDFQANFLKRAEGDVLFTCEDGEAIRTLVQKATESGERENLPVRVTATVPSRFGSEPVAEFTLTLSLKRKK
jgi:acyl-coenzyme A thioesterase PaaI-like protein